MGTPAEEIAHKATGLADMSKLKDPEFRHTPITPERYFSKAWADREWDKVWTKTWQIAGVTAQLRETGDWLTAEFRTESIVCIRGDDGKIRAFYNVCQHRGMPLVTGVAGNAGSRRLTCPYHGWAYELAGTLKTVPDEADFIQGSPCGKLNLVPVKCEVWAGFVWINMDEDAPPLRQFLGPIADQIDTYPMERMVRTHWVTIEGNFNWKLVQDNFNESYHVPFVHPQTKFVMEYSHHHCQFDLYPEGHARMFMPGAGPTKMLRGGENETLQMMAEELKFWDIDPDQFRGGKTGDIRAVLQRVKREKGAEKGYDFSTYTDEQLTDHWHYTIFPNLSFSLKPDGNIWLRARPHESDPEKCYFDMWYLTLFPEGTDRYYSYSMSEWVDVSVPAPYEKGKFGEVSTGPGIDQDVAVWEHQQRGLHSRGYKRDYLAWQERRVRYFHENLEKWMAD
ncbi:aromatic ring-hydroxylating oxygenase subunit alpha [Tsuneonella mangrovi]|uniref:aromatic ring-hydroxylating oxygenase subunit alpha n=1 Tax=Tsuneonella mangrovi TaxID=1982042 RepID=UPI000BA25034|nr:aromatic ring-hydroxylating dioxygenase subunit alpha [Tsuneonella mangrovi]